MTRNIFGIEGEIGPAVRDFQSSLRDWVVCKSNFLFPRFHRGLLSVVPAGLKNQVSLRDQEAIRTQRTLTAFLIQS